MTAAEQDKCCNVQTTMSRRAMLRQLATIGGMGLAVALLQACGSDTSSNANTGAPSAGDASATAPGVQGNQAVTLQVWGFSPDEVRSKARLDTFARANPSITVQPVGGNLNTQQLLTAVASGSPPHVVVVDRVETGSWAGRNAIDPLDDLISRDGFDLAQFYPFLADQVKYRNQTYGVPQFVNVDLMFLNLDVAQQAGIDVDSLDPGNWEQLSQLGEQLHQMNGDVLTRTGFDSKMQDGRLWQWAWANGVDLISADGQTANFADPKVVEALTWGKEAVDRQGGEKARAAFAQSQNFFSAQNPVLIGQTALTLFEQWLIGVMKVNPQANFRAIIPQKRNMQEPLTNATGSALAIPKGIQGAEREAAWTFIKGMAATEAWLAGEKATFEDNKANSTPYTPTITGNIQADQEVWSTIYQPVGPSFDETVKLLPDALKAARFRYSGPVAAQITEFITASINDALQGVKPPQDALNDLQQQAQQAIDDFKNGPGVR